MSKTTPTGWFKFYHRDWVSSSTIRKMSMAAQGIYLNLLLLQWEDGQVPDTLEEAGEILRLTNEEIEAFKPYFSSLFPDGQNPRLALERSKSVEYIEKQKNHGKSKGSPRVATTKPEARQKVAKFVPPTVEEVAEHMLTRRWRNHERKAEQFVAWYEGKGWKVGKALMKDWKSAVITWEGKMNDDDFLPKPKTSHKPGELIEGIHYQVLPSGERVDML